VSIVDNRRSDQEESNGRVGKAEVIVCCLRHNMAALTHFVRFMVQTAFAPPRTLRVPCTPHRSPGDLIYIYIYISSTTSRLVCRRKRYLKTSILTIWSSKEFLIGLPFHKRLIIASYKNSASAAPLHHRPTCLAAKLFSLGSIIMAPATN
jgi:hypothetical protein